MELVEKETSGPLPTTTFELVDGGQNIGFLQLRRSPSKSAEFPPGFESHIYYEISPEFRNKGYGNKILGLGLEKAKALGFKEVVLTCEKANTASRKIIESNGGRLIDTKQNILKYEVSLL